MAVPSPRGEGQGEGERQTILDFPPGAELIVVHITGKTPNTRPQLQPMPSGWAAVLYLFDLR